MTPDPTPDETPAPRAIWQKDTAAEAWVTRFTVGDDALWDALVRRPLSEVLEAEFGDDTVRGIVESAVRAATHVLVPLAPTSAEVERMPVVREMVDDLAHLGRHSAPPEAAAMFTRTNARAVANTEYRELLEAEGWRVLRSHVGQLQRFAQAFGGPIERASASAYGDALAELTGVEIR